MLRIPISVDYGAEEYYWLVPFDCFEKVLAWWLDLEHADIYIQQPPSPCYVLTFGHIVTLSSHDPDFYDRNKHPMHIMLENDYSSYLFWQGQQHRHRGFLQKS